MQLASPSRQLKTSNKVEVVVVEKLPPLVLMVAELVPLTELTCAPAQPRLLDALWVTGQHSPFAKHPEQVPLPLKVVLTCTPYSDKRNRPPRQVRQLEIPRIEAHVVSAPAVATPSTLVWLVGSANLFHAEVDHDCPQ